MAHQSLMELQRGAILRMLNLGVSGEAPLATGKTWKVLVYDKYCQEVVAPLLKVGGLMKHGVTLHLSLHSERLPVADVPAVYFVEPTPANIARIGEDLAKGIYESCYVNFASAVPRSMLTDLALGAMRANAAHKVASVVDRFVSFVALSPVLFSLNLPAAYETIHSPGLADEIMQQYIERVVDGLLSVLVTMRTLPVIRCSPGEASEMVCRRLDERLRELLRGSAGAELFTSGSTTGGEARPSESSSQRPLLCVLDRDVDLVTMLNHTWTYQGMAHDVLGMKLNRINVPDEGGTPGVPAKQKSYAIDESDAFWVQHAGEAFPDAAAAVSEAIEAFKKRKDDMSRSGDGNLEDSLAPGLAAAINALPEMTEKKRSIDMHTNIMTALLGEVQARSLDTYYEMEDQFTSQSMGKSIAQMEKLLSDPRKGTVADKCRALMVLYLTKPSVEQDPKFAPLVAALRGVGGNIAALEYLKMLTGMRRMMTPSIASSVPTASSGGGGAASLIGSLADRMRSTGEGLVTAGFNNIKNIVASKKELPACKILESLVELKPSPATDNFLYLDPKAPPAAYGTEQPRIRTPFRKAIVFVVGGGNYVELQELQEWAQEKGRHVVYGATDVVSPLQFLDELAHLGQAQHGGGGSDLR